MFVIISLLSLFSMNTATSRYISNLYKGNHTSSVIFPQNKCTSFTIGPGTGCAWMCTYCATTLNTNNYYFTDGVCTYQDGGCVGNTSAGVTYTCCAV